jgi:pyruvate dehydrogenase E2 component (dihydrolipoamide acetyltransferase)
MAYEVVLPRLGWNMETGRIGEWLKRDGERVEAGELLFTVEGDKATQEVEALDSGILRIPPNGPKPGQEVPVGTLLAYLVEPAEKLPVAEDAPSAATTATGGPAPTPAAAAPGIAAAAAGGEGFAPTISPRARRVAGELGIDWTVIKGSGRTGRIVERDVRAAHAAQAPAQAGAPAPEKISPLARRLAAELGVDADALAARTPGKRIERADVEHEAARRAAKEDAPAEGPTLPGEIFPISYVRRTIAERMAASSHTTAAVTLTTEADATELVRLRKQLKDDGAAAPSYNDLLAKLCAAALLEHPQVNARFAGDGILQAATANIGVAVDTERGLLVPVLRDVQRKSLRQVAAESAALIEKARTGKIGPDDLQGSTFTITNLGMYEIDAFTPIINLPECAILGAGRIIPKQVVVDADAERVAIRHMMFLSLTFDHRLVDGAPAARFLQRVKQYVEKPYLWLVG